jgi:Ca2+-binding RTX toxin-like protein
VVVAGAGIAAAAQAQQKDKSKPPTLQQGVLVVEGTSGADTIVLRLHAGQPNLVQVDFNDGAADFDFDRVAVTSIAVDAKGGDDTVRVDDTNGVFTDTIPTVIAGGAGNDTLTGGAGAETFLGGDDNDTIDGKRGNDVALMGGGNDTFVWNPGDGSDTVEGQGSRDTLQFNGANIAEHVELSANGSRLRFTRDIASITMDVAGVEQVNFAARGGADTVDVGDLSATAVTGVAVDLGADGAADHVNVAGSPVTVRASATGVDVGDVSLVNAEAGLDELDVTGDATVAGTAGDDAITLAGDSTALRVTSFPALVAVASGSLTVDGLGGNDTISASGAPNIGVALTLDGGPGNDLLTGSRGPDTLVGGTGNDTFVWNAGDGSDVVEGQGGQDTLQFNGANIAEHVELSANGSRLRFTRDIASITMDVAGVEQVNFAARGGADTVDVGDLSATDVTGVAVDLGTDGAADQVNLSGTSGNDRIVASGLTVGILTLAGADAGDALAIDALAGDDVVDASGLTAGVVALTIDGGEGNDVITGSPGDDTLIGGPGVDVIDGDGGTDVIVQ